MTIRTEMKFKLLQVSSESKFWRYFIANVGNTDNLVSSPDLLSKVNIKLTEYFKGMGLGYLKTYVEGKSISQIYVTAFSSAK